jgi:flagellar protein FlaI
MAWNTIQIMDSIRVRGLRRRIINHAANARSERSAGIKTLLEIGAISAETAAYLWMAIDSGLNIIIAGSGGNGEAQLLFSLCPFIPRYEKAFVFGNGVEEMKYYSNFVNFVSKTSKTHEGELKRQIRAAPSLNANRLILERAAGKETRELFWYANRGIPFLATIKASDEYDILKKLKEEMAVAPNTLNMLDIALFMSQGPKSVWAVKSIFEYKWLSRTEYFVEEAKTAKEFEYKTTRIASDYSFDKELLERSKVVDSYSDANVISRKEAMAEYDKRNEFLKGAAQSGLGSLEYINGYFEMERKSTSIKD